MDGEFVLVVGSAVLESAAEPVTACSRARANMAISTRQ